MKGLNVKISEEALKRLMIYQTLKGHPNRDTALDTLLLETLPPLGKEKN